MTLTQQRSPKITAEYDGGLMGRVPPQAIDAEMAALGALMLGGRQSVEDVAGILQRGDFYRESHGALFDAMLALSHAGSPVDIVTLKDELNRRGALESVGGMSYLMALGDFMPTTANAVYYAEIIREKAVLRQFIESASVIAGLAYSGETGAAEVAAQAEKLVMSVRDREAKASGGWQGMPDVGARTMDKLLKRRADGPLASGMVRTGFPRLDDLILLEPGISCILAARPSMGKTAMGLSIAYNVVRQGGSVGVFSGEMTAGSLMERLIAMESGVHGYKVKHPWKMTEDDVYEVSEATGRLWTRRLKIDDTSSLTPEEMLARGRRLKVDHGGELDLLIVDYLQLCKTSNTRRAEESRRTEVAEVSKGLKRMAKELKCPVITLCQLSRAVEKREDKHPALSDLNESGDIEADADVVIGLYRASYYERKDKDTPGGSQGIAEGFPDEVDVDVLKQRDGPTGLVKLGFFSHLTKFVDLDAYRVASPF